MADLASTWAPTLLALLSLLACVWMARSHTSLTSAKVARQLALDSERRELRVTENLEAQNAAFAGLRRDFSQLNDDVSEFLAEASTKLKRASVRQQRADQKAAAAEQLTPPAPPPPPTAEQEQAAWDREKRTRILGVAK